MAEAKIWYYGISPWEIEVLYGYLRSHFDIIQEEAEPNEAEFVSKAVISLPVAFSEAFFVWFEYRRWERIKALFKEMKRRRGSGNAIKIEIEFAGDPGVSFRIDAQDRQWFDNSVEKIDFVLELLPYHVEKLPEGVDTILYRFDERTVRWRLYRAVAKDVQYAFRGDSWQLMEQ